MSTRRPYVRAVPREGAWLTPARRAVVIASAVLLEGTVLVNLFVRLAP